MKRRIRTARALTEALERRTFFSSLNVLTHHVDAMNSGTDLTETVLTPGNVNTTDFSKQFSNAVDGGDVIAQPLYMQNVNITTGSSQGIHSVVFVATEADGLYALDANTGATLWHDNFTNITDPTNLTPTTGVTTILQADINGNPDVGAQLGILATPAIDANTGILYLNANTKEIRGDGKHFVQRLWAVSIYNGAPVMSPALIGDTIAPNGLDTTGPYTYVAGPIINGTGNNNPAGNPTPVYPDTDAWTAAPGDASGYVLAFNAIEQMERTAVSLINGTVYLGFASHGDDGPYYGWVLGYSASNLTLNAVFNTAPTFEPSSIVGSSQPFWCLAGIWMSGSNISTDGTNLYIVTGNGAFNGQPSNFDANGFPIDHDYGDTVLKLTPDSSTVNSQNGNGWGLKVSDYFTPSNQFELNDNDLDLGSGGATLLPNNVLDSAGNPMLVVGGKESRIYLIDRNNMGKFNFNYPTGASSVDPSTYDRVVGEYANDGLNNGSEQIYSSAAYWNGNIYMGVRGTPALDISLASMESGTVTPIKTNLSFGYPGDTLEISANGSTNGVAWALNPGGSDLVAFNASSFAATIYDSNTITGDALGGSIHFHVPMVANGMVYAGSRGGGLSVYGLKLSYLTSNGAFFSAPGSLAGSAVSLSDAHLTWASNSTLAAEFRVDRSTDGSNWTTVQYVTGTTTSYDDTTISPFTKYYYRVVGINGVNSTTASNILVYSPPLTLSGQSDYLRLDPNGTSLDIWTNNNASGGVAQSVILSQLSGAFFTGSGSTSNFTIDFSNGNPLPAGGLIFNSSAGFSTLTLIGDSGNDLVNVGAGTVTLTSTFGTVPISYTNATTIDFIGGAGSNTLTQSAAPGGGGKVSFNNLNSGDTINVSAGAMTIPMPTTGSAAAQLGTLIVGSGAQASLSVPSGSAAHAVLVLGSLSLAGSSGNWLSRLDLAGNDLILHTGNLSTIGSQIAQVLANNWAGNGITDSAAAADSTHLTTIGAITNDDGTGHVLFGNSQFDGQSPLLTDILLKNTFVGDANLSGNVDGSDYSKIDSGFNLHATGWFNGDFNYDQLINGSDYTLIDNAFNSQGFAAASQLAFTTTSPTIVSGTTSGNITVQLRDPLGRAINAPAGGATVNLTSSSNSAVFYNGASVITSILMPAGSNSVSFQFSDTAAGSPIITAMVAGLPAVSQQVTVTTISAPAQLVFSTAPLNLAVGGTSAAITVTLEDLSGNPINAGSGGMVVNLSTNSTAGAFKSLTNTSIGSVTIPFGSSTASFEYSDTNAGVPVLTLSASGVSSAIQQETVTATLTSIAFTTPAHTMIVGTSPATVTIQLDDQLGNPYVAGASGVVVNLSTNSSGGTFYNSNNAVVTSVTVPAGSSSVTFAYRDSQLGSPTLDATVTGLTAINQQQTVSPLPTGTAAFYSFGSSAGMLTDTSGSGNTLKVGAGTVAFTTSGVPVGFTGAANFSNSGYLTTSSGAFPVHVPTGNSSYTIAAWIDINNANKNGIVGWGTWGTTDAVNAFRTTQGDAAPDGAGLDNYWWSNDFIKATPNSLVNNWAYVAVTYNGTIRSIYMNGVLLGTFSSGADAAVASNFRIGSTNNGEFFGGNMADLLIANTAFSAAQIDALYNGT